MFIALMCFTCGTKNKEENSNKVSNKVSNNEMLENKTAKQKSDSTKNKFPDLQNSAFELHYDAIVIDTHNDILMPVKLQGADMTIDNSNTQSDMVKWKQGGLDVQVFSIYVPERFKSNYFNYAMRLIDALEETQQQFPNKLCLAYKYDDVVNCINSNKLCGLMGAEGGAMVEGKIENLEKLYERGIRYLGLTWNTSNEIAISARDETERGKQGGLKEFGTQVVKRMNELGMLIDVSHLGETAFWEVVQISKHPIIASHSCVYNLTPHYRNLKDDQIRAIAQSGGYIGVNFFCKFLEPNANKEQVISIHSKYKKAGKNLLNEYPDDLITFNQKRYEYLTENKTNSGTPVDILIDHIDYIVKLVGIDFVGLGSDFDGSIYTPNEIYDATCYPIITKKLVERGYTEEDIRKILGLNFLRVFKEVCK